MDAISYKTISANKETARKEWVVVDAENEILGRLSSKVAKLMRGKYKTNFTPHVDCGDNVIVVNAEKIRLTGSKWTDREHVRHSGYPGGQRIESPEDIFKKSPERLIQHAVRGMLPKSRLGAAILRNLYVYTGSEHPHEAQQPKKVELNSIK